MIVKKQQQPFVKMFHQIGVKLISALLHFGSDPRSGCVANKQQGTKLENSWSHVIKDSLIKKLINEPLIIHVVFIGI